MKPGHADTNAHLDDAAVARLHDRATTDDERTHVEQHLAQCVECQARLDGFAEQSRTVRGMLELADEPRRPLVRRPHTSPIPRVGRTQRALQRAAIVLLVIGAGVMVARPSRAWVFERWNDLRAVLTGTPMAAPAPEPSAPVADPSPPTAADQPNVASLTFAASSDSLFVRVVSRQNVGQVTIARMDRLDILIEIDGGGDELVGVVPSGLTIQNTATSVASYRISVPRDMRVVVVGIGTDSPMQVDWQNGSVYTVPLSRR